MMPYRAPGYSADRLRGFRSGMSPDALDEARLDRLAVARVVAVAQAARQIELVQGAQRVLVQFDAETRAGWHGGGTLVEGERAGRDDVLGLPRPVGVAGICQVRRRGGQVHHAGQGDGPGRGSGHWTAPW